MSALRCFKDVLHSSSHHITGGDAAGNRGIWLSQGSLNKILSRRQEPVTSRSIAGFQVAHSEAKKYPLMGTSCMVKKINTFFF